MAERTDDLAPGNISTLDRLVHSIDLAEGFALFLARCNVSALRGELILTARQQLAALGVEVVEVAFEDEAANVRERLRAALSAADVPGTSESAWHVIEASPKRAVFVTGLEYGIPYDQPKARVLAELNLGRDLFPRDAPHPLVIWLPDYAVTAVARFAPDFWAWRSGVFEFETSEAERGTALKQFAEDRSWLALANLTPEARLLRSRQLESLLDDYRDLPDDPRVTGERSNILAGLGDICVTSQDFSQAIAYYQRVLELQRQVDDRAGEATTLDLIGTAYSELGDNRKALDFFEQVLALTRQIGDRAVEATALNHIGAVYFAMDEVRQALAFFEQALPLSRQVGDQDDEARTLVNLGLAFSALNEKRKALGYYEQALLLYRRINDQGGEARVLNNLGRMYQELGEKHKALDFYQQALPLWRQVRDQRGEARTLINLGIAFHILGDQRQALDFCEQALPLYRQVGDRGGEATVFTIIGSVCAALGDQCKALDFYGQALPLWCQVGDRLREGITRSNIGRVYEALGDLDKAEQQLVLVAALNEAIGYPPIPYDLAALERVRAKRLDREVTK